VNAAVLRSYARRAIADAARDATLATHSRPTSPVMGAGVDDLLLELLAEKRGAAPAHDPDSRRDHW
jgi:hypothetical protein